jgi:protease YdgD
MLTSPARACRRLAGGVLAAIVLAAATTPGLAQDAPVPTRRVLPPSILPGLGGADPRQPVDRNAEPWRALGRVQLEIGGRCTGALVAPRVVLTAAHCLVARRTGGLVRPGTLHFLLGYHLGRYVAHARVAAYTVGPGYDPAGTGPPSADWALLTLEQPLDTTPDRVLPLRRDLPPPRTPLMLGGYQQDRKEVLMADGACHLLGLRRDATGRPMLVHDCAGTRGVSGGPLLAQGEDGRWAVVGVASTAALDAARGAAVPAAVIGPVP